MSSDGGNISNPPSAPTLVVYYTGLDPQEISNHPEYRLVAAFFLGALFISSVSSLVYSPVFKSFLSRLSNRIQKNDLEALPLTPAQPKDRSRSASISTSVLIRHNNGTLGVAMSTCFAVAGATQFGTLMSFTAALDCAFVVAIGIASEQCGRVFALITLGFHLRGLDIGQVEFICIWVWVAIATAFTLVTNVIGTGTVVNILNPTFGLCYRTHYMPTLLVSSIMYITFELYIIIRLAMLIPRTQHRLAFFADLRLLRALSMLVFDACVIIPSIYYISTIAEFVPFCIGTLFVLAAFHAHLPDSSIQLINTPSFFVHINPTRLGFSPSSVAAERSLTQWRMQQHHWLSNTGHNELTHGRSIDMDPTIEYVADVSTIMAEAGVVPGAYRQRLDSGCLHRQAALQDFAASNGATELTSVVSPIMSRFEVINRETTSATGSEETYIKDVACPPASRTNTAVLSDDMESMVSSGAALIGYLRRGTLEVEMASLEYELRMPTSPMLQFGATASNSQVSVNRGDHVVTVIPDPRDYTDLNLTPSLNPRQQSTQSGDRLSTIASVTTETIISDLGFTRAPIFEPSLSYPSPAQAFAALVTNNAESHSPGSQISTLATRRPPHLAAGMQPSEFLKRSSLNRKSSPPREAWLQVRGPRAPKSAATPNFPEADIEMPTYIGKGKGRKRSSTNVAEESLPQHLSTSTFDDEFSMASSYNNYGYQSSSYPSSSDAVNPYHQDYVPTGHTSGSHHTAPVPANAYEYDVGILAQQSVYVPGAMIDKRGGAGGRVPRGGKRTTVLRKGAGRVWEDQTLLEWNPAWFRLFVGDLSNDVSDDVLTNAFNKYASFTKARVIRDRLSQKAKYGFVAFSDPEDFLKAWKEMDGKYVGNRPVKLRKAADDAIRPVEIGHKKAVKLDQELKRKNKHKPY